MFLHYVNNIEQSKTKYLCCQGGNLSYISIILYKNSKHKIVLLNNHCITYKSLQLISWSRNHPKINRTYSFTENLLTSKFGGKAYILNGEKYKQLIDKVYFFNNIFYNTLLLDMCLYKQNKQAL